MSRSLGELSELVARVSDIYAERYAVTRTDDWYLLKLQEELGEMVAEHLKGTARGRLKGAEADEIRQALEDEAADVLAMFLLFARSQGIDLEAALTRKWFKYLPPDQI